MIRKARLWTGVTLLVVLIFNYAVIGIPLYRKSVSIRTKYRELLLRQAKYNAPFRSPEGEYMLEVFHKEKKSLDQKTLILNCAGASLLILIASWTVFGLFTNKR